MADDEVEIPGLQQVLLDAVHHHGEVALAELWNDHANREGLPSAEGAGEKVRPIIQLLRGGQHTLSGFWRDGLGARSVIHDERDSGRRKPKVLGESLQADRAVFGASIGVAAHENADSFITAAAYCRSTVGARPVKVDTEQPKENT